MSEPVLAPVLIDLSPTRLAAPGTARVVGNFVFFQIAWFACVLGAAHDMAWLGVLVIALVCAWHCTVSIRSKPELYLILTAMFVGAVWESALVSAGLLHYTYGTLVEGLAPAWIVAMWALLAITLNVSMRWLKNRWLLSAAMGAVAGPLSFLAGQRLGAATFTGGTHTIVALSAGWAALMPLMMCLSQRYDGVVLTDEDIGRV
ncbi:MAG: hypothetical protein JWM03_1689 [Rhodocyclales bacterium]|nr:hypothetical protein [Rhodocyclales bacterium]